MLQYYVKIVKTQNYYSPIVLICVSNG